MAACSHSMLLIREGTLDLVPRTCQPPPSTHVGKSVYSRLHVLVSTNSTSYPIAKGAYPIAKGTYPIAKVMLGKQGSISKQSIVAYLSGHPP